MRVELHPAFVLHRRPYRETSALLEVFSQRHGRVGLVARGVRRPRSAWHEALQPFRPLQIAWSGRGELGSVTAAESDAPAPGLSGRPLISGFYMNELLVRLLPRHDPCRPLFQRYLVSIEALGRGQPEEPLLRLFERDLLDTLGYGLQLERDARSGAPLVAGENYLYQAESGPTRSPVDGVQAVPVSGRTLMGLSAGRFEDGGTLAEAKRLLRFLLEPHLGPRPLVSRDLIRPRARAPVAVVPGLRTADDDQG
ncbi:MAG: DNA repair protein RecO [Gammaproteobacteria bacterium]|nr:DNA repair protein RecO [Gammaproteobacteria bacterium]